MVETDDSTRERVRPGRARIEKLAYSIEDDLDMARAAYLVACQQRPDQYIVLALKTQALRRKSGVFRSVSSSSSLRTWPGVSRSA